MKNFFYIEYVFIFGIFVNLFWLSSWDAIDIIIQKINKKFFPKYQNHQQLHLFLFYSFLAFTSLSILIIFNKRKWAL
jgi:hypothetical protein